MKRIIDGKRFDTETARLIGEATTGDSSSFNYVSEELYRTRRGQYFLAGYGGARSKYAERDDDNSWSGGARIIPMTPDEAYEWAQENLKASEVEAEFGHLVVDG